MADHYTLVWDRVHSLACRYYPARRPGGRPVRGYVVLFFGGGWIGGSPDQFHETALSLAEQGWDAILPEYRLCQAGSGLTPFDCYADTREVLHNLIRGMDGFRIDPRRLVLGGASAGGHLALCHAMLPTGTRPAALVLVNPVVDTTQTGYRRGTPRFAGRERELSPIHLLSRPLPPTLILHGEADTVSPVQNIRDFAAKAQRLGTNLELRLYPGKQHGFLNHPSYRPDCDLADYETGLSDIQRFLNRLW